MGDEINLTTPRQVTSFQFQVYAQNLSGNEQLVVHFYPQTGPLNGQGFSTPNTDPTQVIYTSPSIPIGIQNGTTTITLNNLNVTVPADFTWAVQFSGVSGNGVAALAVGPANPAVGYNIADYWQNVGGTWGLYEFSGAAANFGAEITAVPEPAAAPILFLAAAVASTVWLRRAARK
jgi:hypothetical protein